MKTIKVKPWGKDQGDHAVINESDYDPKVHKLLDEADDIDNPSKGLTVDQIKAALVEKGIEVPDGAKKPELAKLLDEAE
ncbi:HeH/LEM domain-containing protein [Pseudomonas abyssi]|uniref:HeH/LEM domain-containing protein n=1 Tax=Pseudomonas abyssi TaxID=170540 RepID=UPI003C7EB8F1